MEARKTTKSKTSPNNPIAHGVGRRKSSVARVWLRRGKGAVIVNGTDYAAYFDTDETKLAVQTPFKVYSPASNYDVEANVNGGGKTGQADAIKLGIARALLEANADARVTLKDAGLLTVDARIKERKKYGQRGARRKFQFVKR